MTIKKQVQSEHSKEDIKSFHKLMKEIFKLWKQSKLSWMDLCKEVNNTDPKVIMAAYEHLDLLVLSQFLHNIKFYLKLVPTGYEEYVVLITYNMTKLKELQVVKPSDPFAKELWRVVKVSKVHATLELYADFSEIMLESRVIRRPISYILNNYKGVLIEASKKPLGTKPVSGVNLFS